jgi:hypothetical protein
MRGDPDDARVDLANQILLTASYPQEGRRGVNMRITIFQLRIVAAAFLLAALHSINAKAESETVDGLTVQIGMANSPKNPRAPQNHHPRSLFWSRCPMPTTAN